MADNSARLGGTNQYNQFREWETPSTLFNYLDREFDFTLDPAAKPYNAKCEKFYTPEENGLEQSWRGERVFCNPPYGDVLGDWVEKCWRERNRAEVIVLLIPSRTDTRYWHDYVMDADEIRFIKGRVKFLKNGERQGSSTFASSVVVFDECEPGNPELKQILDYENRSLG